MKVCLCKWFVKLQDALKASSVLSCGLDNDRVCLRISPTKHNIKTKRKSFVKMIPSYLILFVFWIFSSTIVSQFVHSQSLKKVMKFFWVKLRLNHIYSSKRCSRTIHFGIVRSVDYLTAFRAHRCIMQDANCSAEDSARHRQNQEMEKNFNYSIEYFLFVKFLSTKTIDSGSYRLFYRNNIKLDFIVRFLLPISL